MVIGIRPGITTGGTKAIGHGRLTRGAIGYHLAMRASDTMPVIGKATVAGLSTTTTGTATGTGMPTATATTTTMVTTMMIIMMIITTTIATITSS
jgi:hypothetical protein